jgi:hypothetical protein
MKKFLVHSLTPPRTENKSARRMKQATLVVALLLPGIAARAQRFPDATELLANVRLRQSQQEIDLHGQLRQEAKIVPFHLVQNGPVVRYIFNNPDETLQLRIGANDSRLDEIKRSGSEKITQLNEAVRGTAIAYEDLALKFLYWSNARVIGADFIRTRNCWKIQLQAPGSDSQYGSILLWVDKDNGALMRMEGYDSAGKMIKRFEVVSAQKIENRWYLKQMRVERIDPQSGRVTARTYLEINK